jgi:hypothetical protein
MPIDYRKYPPTWKETRARILERASHRCERCGLPNHAVGYRDEAGTFIPNGGNGPCDASGAGRCWPDIQNRLSYAEAREFVDQYNDHGTGKRQTDADGNHWIVIVLTVAHLDPDGPKDCPDDRLMAMCQRCHLHLDGPHHRWNARKTRANKKQRTFERAAVAPLLEV